MIALFLAGKVKYEQKMAAQKPFDVAGSVLLFLAVTRDRGHHAGWRAAG